MRYLVEIENIEEMRRQQGIEDVELREGIRGLRAGDFVKLTLRSGTKPSPGETLPVRITSIRGATFRGKLARKPAAPGLAGLALGAVVVFTAAQIHSLANRLPNPKR
jgi:hypothetical protein